MNNLNSVSSLPPEKAREKFQELARSASLIATLFARLPFRERSVAGALERPETLSVKMLSSVAKVSDWQSLVRLDAELEELSDRFVPPPLWLAWFENVHRETAERLQSEVAALGNETAAELKGCIYVSYASEDQMVVRFIVRQLEEAGLLVWMDALRLHPTSSWTSIARSLISESCGIFLSVVSEQSAGRREGGFQFERRLAAARAAQFPPGAPFYIPLRIDDGVPLVPANEPAPASEEISAYRFPGGRLSPDFLHQLRVLQDSRRAAPGPITA